MLQIRLINKGLASDGSGGGKILPVETVTVACPDHLVLADLPVAKSIGAASTASIVKIVGRRSRRYLGERVHFCVCCDFPIAIYGRLSPCEHAFCLDCARSDSSCYLCDERIQKIQTIKLMEGILVCAAPHCLKSFLKRSEFETHIHESHADLLQPNMMKEDGNESDAFNVTRPSSTDAHGKQSSAADISTARTQPRTVFSPSSNSQPQDLDDKARQNQPRDQPPPKPSIIQPKLQSENNPPLVFDRRGPYNRFHNQHNFDMQGSPLSWRDSDQFPDKQQGILSEFALPVYPPQSHQPPNFVVPINAKQGLAPSAYNIPLFHAEGVQPFYNAPYETTGPDMPSESGQEHGSLLGFPPAPAAATSYPPLWNMGAGMPFEQMPASQGISESYTNHSDAQGRATYFQGEHQKGILAPPPPCHPSQFQRGNFSCPGDAGWEGQSYGWQHEKHDGYGGSQE